MSIHDMGLSLLILATSLQLRTYKHCLSNDIVCLLTLSVYRYTYTVRFQTVKLAGTKSVATELYHSNLPHHAQLYIQNDLRSSSVYQCHENSYINQQFLHFDAASTILYQCYTNLHTTDLEIFIVKIFSCFVRTTKIKRMKYILQ